jgi:hypothetical protein
VIPTESERFSLDPEIVFAMPGTFLGGTGALDIITGTMNPSKGGSKCRPGDCPCNVAALVMWPRGADYNGFQAFRRPTGHITSSETCNHLRSLPQERRFLNRYFIRPTTVDRIRASWIGEPIERYVSWARRAKLRRAECFCTCANPAPIWTVCTRSWCKPLGGNSGSCCAVR